MKQIIIIIVVFTIAFATSVLYDLQFILRDPVRKILVTLLIVVELIIGLYMVKVLTIKK